MRNVTHECQSYSKPKVADAAPLPNPCTDGVRCGVKESTSSLKNLNVAPSNLNTGVCAACSLYIGEIIDSGWDTVPTP